MGVHPSRAIYTITVQTSSVTVPAGVFNHTNEELRNVHWKHLLNCKGAQYSLYVAGLGFFFKNFTRKGSCILWKSTLHLCVGLSKN